MSFLWAGKDWNPFEWLGDPQKSLKVLKQSDPRGVQMLAANEHGKNTIFRLNQILLNSGWYFSTCIEQKEVSLTMTISAFLFP